MSVVLVTGASGFIGSRISTHLATLGHDVIGLGRPEARPDIPFAAWKTDDISLEVLWDFARDASLIYHCAGSGSVATSLDNPLRDFSSNVVTTQAVLEFARLQAKSKVVLLSSAGVYGATANLPISIHNELNPISPYGSNKQICEVLARQYGRHFNVPTAIVRLFSVYGEGLRKQLLWDAAQKIRRRNPVFFGTGKETRDWIHVDDAARLIVMAAALATPEAPVINGGSGQAVKIAEVINGLAERLGFSGRIQFTGDSRPGDPTDYQAELTEAFATGWKPQVSLRDGLDRYVEWFVAVN